MSKTTTVNRITIRALLSVPATYRRLASALFYCAIRANRFFSSNLLQILILRLNATFRILLFILKCANISHTP